MLRLQRVRYGPRATEGVLALPGEERLLRTLELPWKGNRQQVSCIPEGTYPLQAHVFDGRYETARVEGVTGRAGIVFHIGNTPDHTDGCILVGLRSGTLGGAPAVLASTAAFREIFWPAVGPSLPLAVKITSATKMPTAEDIRNNYGRPAV